MDLVEAASSGQVEGVRHPWETARLEVVKRLIAAHAQLAAGSVVVDIGCGDAFVASALAGMFPASTFFGVDSALTPARITAAEAGASAGNLRLFADLDLVQAPRPASLVLLMDVLEHIEDDGAFLGDLLARKIIDRGTCVLVTVPAYQWLFSAHDVFLKHYRRYTNRTLRRQLERAGLQVVASGYFFLSLVPLRLLQVIKERIIGRPETAATDLMTSHGPASAAIFSHALVADAAVALTLGRVGIRVPGLSNYAICRKSA